MTLNGNVTKKRMHFTYDNNENTVNERPHSLKLVEIMKKQQQQQT